MLATGCDSAEIGNPDARKRLEKKNLLMEKFKELSTVELININGGDFSLWSPSIILVEFAIGFLETYSDSLQRYHNEIQYQ